MKKHTVLLCLLLLLPACAGNEQRLCEAHIKEQLLNPETAEFFDFDKVNDDALANDYRFKYMKDDIGKENPSDIDGKAKPGTTFFRMRLRAEGVVGNKITQFPFCAVPPSGEKCTCVLLDN